MARLIGRGWKWIRPFRLKQEIFTKPNFWNPHHDVSPKHHFLMVTLWETKIAMEFLIFHRKYIFKGSVFHCYVSLPECNRQFKGRSSRWEPLLNLPNLGVESAVDFMAALNWRWWSFKRSQSAKLCYSGKYVHFSFLFVCCFCCSGFFFHLSLKIYLWKVNDGPCEVIQVMCVHIWHVDVSQQHSRKKKSCIHVNIYIVYI